MIVGREYIKTGHIVLVTQLLVNVPIKNTLLEEKH